MSATIHTTPRIVLFALLIACGCASRHETSTMDTQPKGPSGQLQSDPHFYKLNSVIGRITSGGQAVAHATITIVKTGEKVPVKDNGTFVLVLDPKKLGGNTHELLISAPGFKDQKHTVTIPENNQVRLDVELTSAR